MPSVRCRAAVLGSPVAHSLSPVLHGAAYRTLGLLHWSYEAIDCDDAALPGFVRGLDDEWAGLSVTMPGKRAALETADSASDAAIAVGAANTLVRREDGWFAECTDVDGVIGALRAAGLPEPAGAAVVLGAGGTACAALAGLARLGASSAIVVARSAQRATDAVACAARIGLTIEVQPWSSLPSLQADVLVSTVPAGALESPPSAGSDLVAGAVTTAAAVAPVVLDVVYHPWPTALALAVTAAGGRLVTGLDMLLHQAFGQVELFTRRSAPRTAMRDALRDAVLTRSGGTGCPPLPL